jgi:methylase of polypeptide subunit release factors
MTTLREVLAAFMARLQAAGVESARLNAELILAHVLGVDRAGVRGMLHTVPDPAQVAETPSNTRAWLCR